MVMVESFKYRVDGNHPEVTLHVSQHFWPRLSYGKKAEEHEDHCLQNGRPLLGFASGHHSESNRSKPIG